MAGRGDRGARRRPAALRRALLAVAGLFLGVSVYLANAQAVGNDRIPMPFGVGAAVVLSGSMEPALHVNDVVVVRRTQDVDVGDVVVYQSAGSLVVHRVVSAGGGSVVTRGDANGADDAPVPVGSVKGVVAFSVPAVGALVQALRSPAGIVAVLALVTFLVERSYEQGRRAHERELAEIAAEIRRLRADPPVDPPPACPAWTGDAPPDRSAGAEDAPPDRSVGADHRPPAPAPERAGPAPAQRAQGKAIEAAGEGGGHEGVKTLFRIRKQAE